MEDADLWEAWTERGDISARDALAEKYIYLLHRTAGKMIKSLPSHIQVTDLISYGSLGMMRALDNFDPALGKRFGSYAVACIRGSILDEIRSIDWAPKSLRKKERDLEETRKQLRVVNLSEPSAQEVADQMGIPVESVRDTEWRVASVNHDSVENLREFAGWDCTAEEDVVASVLITEAQEIFLEWLEQQTESDQVLLSLCYYEKMTLIDVSRRMRCPEPTVVSRHTLLVLDLRDTMEQALTEDS